MEELGLHIQHLLKTSPKVYLPGIGTFKKKRVAAYFDEDTNSFFPPTYTIFLDAEKGSPELIITYISKSKHISIEESDQLLKSIVGSILLVLNEQGEYEITDLGKLFQSDGEINFTEEESIKRETSLKAVQERKLIAPTPIHEEQIDNSVDFDADNESPILAETEHTEVQDEVEFEPKGRAINWLWPLLIILFLIGAAVYWYFSQLNDKNKTINVEDIATQPYLSPNIESSLTDTLPDQQADSLNSNTDTLSVSPDSTVVNNETLNTLTQNKISYEIIIVSFGKFAEAESYVETMKRKGIAVKILENKRSGNLFKISSASFDSNDEAQIELNKVRENLSKDAWIYTMKP